MLQPSNIYEMPRKQVEGLQLGIPTEMCIISVMLHLKPLVVSSTQCWMNWFVCGCAVSTATSTGKATIIFISTCVCVCMCVISCASAKLENGNSNRTRKGLNGNGNLFGELLIYFREVNDGGEEGILYGLLLKKSATPSGKKGTNGCWF